MHPFVSFPFLFSHFFFFGLRVLDPFIIIFFFFSSPAALALGEFPPAAPAAESFHLREEGEGGSVCAPGAR